MKPSLRIYFLCGENRCRSQIAEAYAKGMAREDVIINSAGLHPSEIHLLTHSVMNEVGIDLNSHHSKKIDMKTFIASTIVVKLCEEIKEKCPVVPFGTRNVLWNIQDPLLGITPKIENVRLARDEIKQNVLDLLKQYNALKE
ncbi:hypothetical protein BK133_25995 [Paenibacillus sp. FSL H8-0548]|uniref:arsenate reductase ArsC n=1 Tax=Paenibacillus sp. FSL H8-0548 TaxID=1920422 RepID=UPI00096CD3C8|nr:arsenate reductase ArsC [Paenibacillus sp. FSL H8-0548]OMF22580.1 hypothetical protein BK133_25995 [Paenibacillus sp. FSL H8-0548]